MKARLNRLVRWLRWECCLALVSLHAHSDEPVVVGTWPGYRSWYNYAAVVAEPYAYVASDTEGLQVLDIHIPAAPVRLGGYNPNQLLPGGGVAGTSRAVNLTVSDHYAYVAFYDPSVGNGVHILDIADPKKPVLESIVFEEAECLDVAVAGHYAYVAGNDFRIADVTNPKSPREIGALPIASPAVAVDGNYAYLVSNDALEIVDVSLPQTPHQVGQIRLPSEPRDVVVAWPFAYVANGVAGLQIVNVTDPTSPTRVGRYDTSGDARGVAVQGQYACVADDRSGLVVVDVSNPAAPKRVGSILTRRPWGSHPNGDPGEARSVVLAGNQAFVGQENSGLDIIDISKPSAPMRAGSFPLRGTHGLYPSGRYLYVTEEGAGMRVLDLINPAAPVEVGHTTNEVQAMRIAGDTAYAVFFGSSLAVLDIADPSAIKRVATFPASSRNAWEPPWIDGRHAYLPVNGVGLQIYDVADRSNPTLVGTFASSGYFGVVGLFGHYAYLKRSVTVTGKQALLVVDVSEPKTPRLVGTYEDDAPFEADAAVRGGPYLFFRYVDTVSEDRGVEVMEVSDPRQPKRIARYPVNEGGFNWEVVESRLYLYTDSGLEVLDVSDPMALQSVGRLNSPSRTLAGFAVSGNYAYFGIDYSGLVIARLSNAPEPPRLEIARSGTQVLLSWPASAGNFVLETSLLLGSGNTWAPVSVGVTTNGNKLTATVESSGRSAYYRLRKP